MSLPEHYATPVPIDYWARCLSVKRDAPLTVTPKNVTALSMYDQIRGSVCAAFGIPKNLLDMAEQSFPADDVVKRNFQETAVAPRVRLILEAINLQLIYNEAENVESVLRRPVNLSRMFFAIDNIVQPDRSYDLQNRAQVTQEVAGNLRTVNEGREAIGLEPATGYDKFMFQIVGAGIGAASAPNLIGPTKSVKSLGGYRSDPPNSKPLADALRGLFQRQGEEVLATVTTSVLGAKAFVPMTDWTEEMRRVLTPVLRVYADEGSNAILGAVGGSPEMRRLAVLNLDAAVDKAALALAQSTLSTTELSIDTAVTELREAMRNGLSEGEAARQLSERVQGIFTNLSDQRAYMIADTEATRAKHAGELIAVEVSGVETKKVWLADNMACPVCSKIDGTSRELDQPFLIKGTGPYAVVDHPPAHPNCLLGETPVFAPDAVQAFKAFYSGPAIRIKFASGDDFTCTPNHMLLTPTGFAKASDLMQGDDVIYCPLADGEIAGVPNDNRKPTRIDEIVSSFAESSGVTSTFVPVAPKDLHGDGTFCQGDVNIITAHGHSRSEGDIGGKMLAEPDFTGGTVGLGLLNSESDLTPVLISLRDATDGGMSGIRESKSLLWRAFSHSERVGFACGSDGDSFTPENSVDGRTSDAELLAKCIGRVANKITVNKVVDVKIISHNGPVYDLETKTSLYIIGSGIVSSNCRCSLNYEFKE